GQEKRDRDAGQGGGAGQPPHRQPGRQGSRVMGGWRSVGSLGSYGGWGVRKPAKYATSASMSCEPPSTSVPCVSTVKPSPPVAMKLFTVIRKVVAGETASAPPATMSTPFSVADTILLQGAAAASHVNRKPFEICMIRSAICAGSPGIAQPVNCCSRKFLSCWAVSVMVTSVLLNGCTVNASP